MKKRNRIALEDLAIRKMMQEGQRCLHRAIAERNRKRRIQQLIYEAASAGGEVVLVGLAHTATDCSRCGLRRAMPLSERVFKCSRCGLEADRDLNLSWNVLQRACALAGWELPGPGAAQGIRQHVGAIAGHDAEQCEFTVPKPSVRTARHSRM